MSVGTAIVVGPTGSVERHFDVEIVFSLLRNPGGHQARPESASRRDLFAAAGGDSLGTATRFRRNG